MALIVPPTAVHTVITDDQISEGDADSLRSAGIELILA
jgi:DeoR family transcriptional regulator of aga operon